VSSDNLKYVIIWHLFSPQRVGLKEYCCTWNSNRCYLLRKYCFRSKKM